MFRSFEGERHTSSETLFSFMMRSEFPTSGDNAVRPLIAAALLGTYARTASVAYTFVSYAV